MNWIEGALNRVANILPQPRFSEDREHFSPTYKNPCVSTELEKRVSVRLRMVAASNGREAIEWVPESHYTRDLDTGRVNVLRDVRDILVPDTLHAPKHVTLVPSMDTRGANRLIITSIAPVWATNEVIDPQLGGFRISIERLFCGVPPHPAYTHVLEATGLYDSIGASDLNDTNTQFDQQSLHPDDTGVVQFFVAPRQRGGFANMYQNVYTTRAKLHEIAQFAGREDVLLSPASRSTLRDAMQYDTSPLSTPLEPMEENDDNDNDNDNNNNNTNNDTNTNNETAEEQASLIAPPATKGDGITTRLPPVGNGKKSDFELVGMDHPMMRLLNEFGAPEHDPGHPSDDVWPSRTRMIYRGDIEPIDPSNETSDVRKQLGTMPTMYRVRTSCLQRVRRWLVASKFSKLRYTRLNDTGLRIITTSDQSRALYRLYKDTLIDRPEQAPCVTVILLITYMTIQDNDRVSRIVAKTALK